jgi:hypothetical protein
MSVTLNITALSPIGRTSGWRTCRHCRRVIVIIPWDGTNLPSVIRLDSLGRARAHKPTQRCLHARKGDVMPAGNPVRLLVGFFVMDNGVSMDEAVRGLYYYRNYRIGGIRCISQCGRRDELKR